MAYIKLNCFFKKFFYYKNGEINQFLKKVCKKLNYFKFFFNSKKKKKKKKKKN